KINSPLKLPTSRRPRGHFRGELSFAAWEWVRLHLLPEPHSSARPQKRLVTAARSQRAMPLCSDSPRQRKSWRPISGSSITNSEEYRTAKNRAELEIRSTPKH